MKELTFDQKLDIIACCLFDCYCLPSIFWENVGTDKQLVWQQIREAKTEKDIRKIVGQYV